MNREVQSKSDRHFRPEARPAPPVYRPSNKTVVAAKTLQRTTAPVNGPALRAIGFPTATGLPRPVLQCMEYMENVKISAVTAGEWQTHKKNQTDYNNCTDFAFEEDAELSFINDLTTLIKHAIKSGKYKETSDIDEATIILYGKGHNYSHAIRRIGSEWFEVLGNDINRYTSGSTPPSRHGGDDIVAALVKL